MAQNRIADGRRSHSPALIELTNEVLLTATKLLRKSWAKVLQLHEERGGKAAFMGPLQTGNDLVSALMKEAINWIYCWDCYRDEHREAIRYMGCQLGVPRSRDHSFFYCGYQPLHVETAKWMVELRALPKEENKRPSQRRATFGLLLPLPRSSPRA